MNTKGVKGNESISWAPHPPASPPASFRPLFPPAPASPLLPAPPPPAPCPLPPIPPAPFPRPLFPPPSPPPKKGKKIYGDLKSMDPFSYKLPVISYPTRTLLRQRYISFAVPSFFCFATGIQNVRKRRRPYRKSEAFDSVVRRRRLWTVTVRYSYLPVVFQWCAFLEITLIFARCDVWR